MNTKLKAARIASGKTQAQVAKEASVSERSYIYYENGVKEPRVRTAIHIAQALDTTAEELFGDMAKTPGGNRAAEQNNLNKN